MYNQTMRNESSFDKMERPSPSVEALTLQLMIWKSKDFHLTIESVIIGEHREHVRR